MIVLGIETTCDETAAAVIERADDGRTQILSNIVLSQVSDTFAQRLEVYSIRGKILGQALHRRRWCGVVPTFNARGRKREFGGNTCPAPDSHDQKGCAW